METLDNIKDSNNPLSTVARAMGHTLLLSDRSPAFNYGIYELRQIYSVSKWTSYLGLQIKVNPILFVETLILIYLNRKHMMEQSGF